ncbi:MAG: hypothetical protein JKY88_05185 [Pseudomonadales bacterium]|nr:hypothetical protein [Pseudomonadales bacterium]
MKAMNVLKVINVIDFCQNRFGSTPFCFPSTHSELAMTAAKKMRRTKSKEKTGHKVCLHLLDMLAEDQPSEAFRRGVDERSGKGKYSTKEDNLWFGATIPNLFNKESSRQISLSF